MSRRVVKASTGNAAPAVSATALDGMISQLDLDDVGSLEPETQDMVRAGSQRLDHAQREELFYRLAAYFQGKEHENEARATVWKRVKNQLEGFYKQIQTFVRSEKQPTKFTTPALGRGERADIWMQRMSRILQSWRRGKRVDVIDRLTDDGAFTLYFDDYGDFQSPVTFAVRVTKQGELYSVDFEPGNGEVDRLVGGTGREQLRLFFHAVASDDRGHKDVFHRFVRRMNRATKVKAAPTLASSPGQ